MDANDVLSILTKDISKTTRMANAVQGMMDQVAQLRKERDEARKIAQLMAGHGKFTHNHGETWDKLTKCLEIVVSWE